MAFGLLALANAHRAGVRGASQHMEAVHALAEEQFFEAEHGLYIDSFTQDFSEARCQNTRGPLSIALSLYTALSLALLPSLCHY